MIVSTFGRFCLEIGKQIEAISLFSIIEDQLHRKKKEGPKQEVADLEVMHMMN